MIRFIYTDIQVHGELYFLQYTLILYLQLYAYIHIIIYNKDIKH